MEPLKSVLTVHDRPVLTVHSSTGNIERMVQTQQLRDEFTSRLKKAIASNGIPIHGSGAYLCRLTKVTPKAASKWLNAESMPGAAKMKAISDGLGVRLEWLQYGVEPMTSEVKTLHRRPITSELELHDTEIVEGDGPLEYDEVELPCFREVEFAAGDGRTQVIENHGASMRFSLARLSRAGVQPSHAACATVKGTSMEPTIADGSPIAIDKGSVHIVDGKIYALEHGGELRVKRLYKMPLNRIRLVSDNAEEYPEEVYMLGHEDAPRILGRVFWWEVFDSA
ncbi:LexA family transcriptional regulator [Vreelandella aquamarina]|uniref:LexA family transcriptional regulator n=1 Tax=Vreelandella aquamarina TaxID=77097 RepID=UPI00078487BB|nr:helix-turn-helix transcriptional regulator [Halomonas axialensis]